MNIFTMTSKFRRVRCAMPALLLLAVLGLPASAGAQTDGRFSGVVADATGTPIPGATVTIKNERTGEERTVQSNTQGL